MSYLTKGYATAFLFFIYLMALYWQISLLTLDFLFSFLCMLWRYLLSETPKHVYDKFRFLCGVAFSIKLQWKCPQVFSFVHVTKLLLLSTPGLNSSLSLPGEGGGVHRKRKNDNRPAFVITSVYLCSKYQSKLKIQKTSLAASRAE